MRVRRTPSPEALRRAMVESQVRRRGVTDACVLEALREVPRHRFVRERDEARAYADCALSIGHGATISQPYIVARMTAALRPDRGLRVLEVGTGSGYQAAVLAACGCEVWSVERVRALHERAAEVLADLGLTDRIRLRLGDGRLGWPEEAPFDRILVTAAAPALPPALPDQLSPGGVLVAPIGDDWDQVIRIFEHREGRLVARSVEPVRFVPLLEGVDAGDPDDGSARTPGD
ncbi:MAG: protein-L-isoaspartate(D-aspartate) O-methyltransferase [Gemmatimonadota bacterium]|nr:protein-L-isoaspartate(D-aspartate) O-methyltransferase [Gemmatimonadota bacterium]